MRRDLNGLGGGVDGATCDGGRFPSGCRSSESAQAADHGDALLAVECC
jgi:hypothetical protein